MISTANQTFQYFGRTRYCFAPRPPFALDGAGDDSFVCEAVHAPVVENSSVQVLVNRTRFVSAIRYSWRCAAICFKNRCLVFYLYFYNTKNEWTFIKFTKQWSSQCIQILFYCQHIFSKLKKYFLNDVNFIYMEKASYNLD